MAIGRPRGYDPDTVLDIAMRLFWEHGYDGVSITDLTEATGINRRSLYAEYGSKEQLFRDAVRRYQRGHGGYGVQALAQPTAWGVAHALTHGAADASSTPERPQGCLMVQGALAVGADASPLHTDLAERRAADVERLAARFAEAQAAGEIPGQDPLALARWITAVCQGIAVQANSGASREDLHAIADQALKAWPQP
jgi:AcrR family transcriptional regulator